MQILKESRQGIGRQGIGRQGIRYSLESTRYQA